MSPEEMASANWVDRFNGQIVKSSLVSTLKSADKIHIDYFIVDNDLLTSLVSIEPVIGTPWGPHVGLKLTMTSTPRAVQGKVIVVPKPLPMSNFLEHLATTEPAQQSILYEQAQAQASQL